MHDELHVLAIFEGLIILEARHRYDRMCTEYLAIGDVFDEKQEGEEAPYYTVTLSEAGTVTFQRVEEHLAAYRADGDRDADSDL